MLVRVVREHDVVHRRSREHCRTRKMSKTAPMSVRLEAALIDQVRRSPLCWTARNRGSSSRRCATSWPCKSGSLQRSMKGLARRTRAASSPMRRSLPGSSRGDNPTNGPCQNADSLIRAGRARVGRGGRLCRRWQAADKQVERILAAIAGLLQSPEIRRPGSRP